MDKTFFDKVHASTVVHSTILDLAKLEGQYASSVSLHRAGIITEAEKDEVGKKVQAAIHDLVTQACHVGLARGYRDGVERSIGIVRRMCHNEQIVDHVDIVEALCSLTQDPELVRIYTHEEAFRP
jgi:hypothetical protein